MGIKGVTSRGAARSSLSPYIPTVYEKTPLPLRSERLTGKWGGTKTTPDQNVILYFFCATCLI